MSERECRNFTTMAVRHEAKHFSQWQKIAVQVLSFLGHEVKDVKPGNLPSAMGELEKHNGARAAFMRVWADPAHYQCREVEVYATQMEKGEMGLEKNRRNRFSAPFTGALRLLRRPKVTIHPLAKASAHRMRKDAAPGGSTRRARSVGGDFSFASRL